MGFSERLGMAMSDAGFTQGRLAKEVGMAQSSVNKLLNGANGSRKTVEIASVLGVRPEWLSSGEMPMRDNRADSSIPHESKWGTVDGWDSKTPLPDDEVEVPFLKDIEFACGDGRVHDEDYNGFKLRFSKSTLRRIGASTDGSGVLCFPAVGNSMEPFIPDGSTVAINCHDKRIVDGKVYAINQEGWKRLKMLYRIGPDLVSLRSFNSEEHPDEERQLSEIEIIGRMFWSSTLW